MHHLSVFLRFSGIWNSDVEFGLYFTKWAIFVVTLVKHFLSNLETITISEFWLHIFLHYKGMQVTNSSKWLMYIGEHKCFLIKVLASNNT